jgi:hypothetical protein
MLPTQGRICVPCRSDRKVRAKSRLAKSHGSAFMFGFRSWLQLFLSEYSRLCDTNLESSSEHTLYPRCHARPYSLCPPRSRSGRL